MDLILVIIKDKWNMPGSNLMKSNKMHTSLTRVCGNGICSKDMYGVTSLEIHVQTFPQAFPNFK